MAFLHRRPARIRSALLTALGTHPALPVAPRWKSTSGRCLLPGLATLLAIALSLAPLQAQEAPPSGGDGTDRRPLVTGFIEGGTGALRLADEHNLLFGARMGLQLHPHLRGGGAGVLLRHPARPSTASLSPFEISFGYGGIFLEGVMERHGFEGAAELLLGAAHVRLHGRYSNVEMGSENLRFAEPALSLRRTLSPHLQIGLRFAHRFISPPDRIPELSREDLQGETVQLFLRLRQRP